MGTHYTTRRSSPGSPWVSASPWWASTARARTSSATPTAVSEAPSRPGAHVARLPQRRFSLLLCQGMLYKDPNRRLGGGPTDGEEVKAHPFWAGSDWVAVLQRRITPPFKPNVGADGDVKYFDKEFLDMPAVNSEVGGEREVKHF